MIRFSEFADRTSLFFGAFHLLLILGLILVVYVSSVLVQGTQSFVRGENTWSTSQKEAVIHLHQHAVGSEPGHFRRFQIHIGRLVAARKAREMLLQSGTPTQLLMEAGNPERRAKRMVAAFPWLRNFQSFQSAVQIWKSSDALVDSLRRIGRDLRAQTQGDATSPGLTHSSLSRLGRINHRLTTLEERFRAQIARAEDQLMRWIWWISVGWLAGLVVTGSATAYGIMSRERKLRTQLKHRALHDELTGLANRFLLREQLERVAGRTERSERLSCLLYLDLNDFKEINDTLGHLAGDEILRSVGERLLDYTRSQDTAARIGGDEFAVILEDLDHPDEAKAAADRIANQLSSPVPLSSQTVQINTAIGLALCGSSDRAGTIDPALAKNKPAEWVRRADQGMYQAKRRPGSAIEFYDPDHEIKSSRHTGE